MEKTFGQLTSAVADPGGGRIGRGPPFFRTILIFSGLYYYYFFFFFFFFFFACHPGGRSGRRTVPLPNNVNVGPKNSGGKMCRSPPPPPPLSDFFRPDGEFRFPAPPFHKSWIRHCSAPLNENGPVRLYEHHDLYRHIIYKLHRNDSYHDQGRGQGDWLGVSKCFDAARPVLKKSLSGMGTPMIFFFFFFPPT